MRTASRFLLPDSLLIAGGVAVTFTPSLRATATGVAPTVLAVALAAGALLGVRFRRGRVVLLVAMLALTAFALSSWVPLLGEGARAAVALAATLLPLTMMVVALLPERGALTSAGLIRLAGIGTVFLGAAALTAWAAEPVVKVLDAWLLHPDAFAWTPIPQPALAVLAVALVLFAALWLREPSAMARGLFWSLIAVVAALHELVPTGAPLVWFALAALVLVFAVIESSYALAFHDPLTGLPARRALTEALHQPGHHYTIAMIDVDHFKQCNDTWGHDVGDQVLKMVASRLNSVGGTGHAFRYGGEEFAVLFPGLTADLALPYLERLRAMVEESSFAVRLRPRPTRKPARRKTRKSSPQVNVTISIGFAEGNGKWSPEAVLAAADKALYRAKANGRNRIEA